MDNDANGVAEAPWLVEEVTLSGSLIMTTAGSAFAGKVILISGAGRKRGQGVAEARKLIEQGASVLIGDICDDEGMQLASNIGARCRYIHLDVTSEANWQNALEAAAQLGKLHGLVNNAAVYIPKPLAETSNDEFNLHMQVNQYGAFLGMKAVAPVLAKHGGGSIVNVSSVAGLRGSPGSIAYCSTKWAIRGMSKAAAADLARFNIRVNSIHPGPIATDMIAGIPAERRRRVPLGRDGGVDEVADLVSFLLSDSSAYITGAEIAIDGGVSL